MAGISSKSAGGLENKKKYNGIEFDSDFDINEYDAYFRNLDPQTGRWWQIDPEVENGQESESPYSSMANDPILNSDPLGNLPETNVSNEVDCGCCPNGAAIARWGLKAGAVIIVAGLGPEDPAADVVAGVVVTVTEVVAGVVTLWELLSSDEIKKPAPPASPPATTQTTTQPTTKERSASDQKLIDEAKAKQEKEAKTNTRANNKQTQTNRGNSRTGNSNQGTRGSHNSGGRNTKKHEAAEARRAREQAAADAVKKAAKKKKS